MLKHVLILFLLCSLISAHAYEPPIVPKPETLTLQKGQFVMTSETKIVTDGSENTIISDFLNSFLEQFYGFRAKKIKSSTSTNQGISFLFDSTLEEEEYVLRITPFQITVKGGRAGLFYGLQSLLQLMPVQRSTQIVFPCLEIRDRPKFKYRGAMLDVGRYFYSVPDIKRFLDLMAYYKLNVFHWHMTENDGWRMEVYKYPLLTEIGAWRMGTHTSPAARENIPSTFDKLPHGGFYTQKQIKEIIKYARDRHINIIPEIDVPGHSRAALEAYPYLSCDPYKNTDVLCLGRESTYTFVKDVLDETIALFPFEIIHIGGDEANKEAWRKCSACQKKMRDHGLKDEDELQGYFINQMAAHIESRGRKMIGWDEVMEDASLTPSAMVMSWRGVKGGIKAAAQQREVVMSPNDFLYLDYFQGPKEYEPVSFAKMLTLQTVYDYDPFHDIPFSDRKFIKGIQANIWTQCIHGQSKLDYMTFPRLLAVAEVAWSNSPKDFVAFYRRMGSNLAWLTKMNVNYRVPEPLGLVDTEADTPHLLVELEPIGEGAQIYYTTDGDEDILRKGRLYDGPIPIDLRSVEEVTLKCVVRTAEGKLSGIRTATYRKK